MPRATPKAVGQVDDLAEGQPGMINQFRDQGFCWRLFSIPFPAPVDDFHLRTLAGAVSCQSSSQDSEDGGARHICQYRFDHVMKFMAPASRMSPV